LPCLSTKQERRISVPSPLSFYLRKNPACCRAISVVEKLRAPLANLWPDRTITVY
jgi:hypothetical protein